MRDGNSCGTRTRDVGEQALSDCEVLAVEWWISGTECRSWYIQNGSSGHVSLNTAVIWVRLKRREAASSMSHTLMKMRPVTAWMVSL
jgi:hypothetical protein